VLARAADKWARAGCGSWSAGLTGRARWQGAGEGKSERPDPKRAVGIGFDLIKHGLPDLRRMPKIYSPARTGLPGHQQWRRSCPWRRPARDEGTLGPHGAGKGSRRFKGTWRTRAWAQHRHRALVGGSPQRGGSVATRLYSDEQSRTTEYKQGKIRAGCGGQISPGSTGRIKDLTKGPRAQ
jgi:hypothetical protein